MPSKLFNKVFSLGKYYTLANLAQKSVSILLFPLYTYYLSPEDFGVLAIMTLVIALLTRAISSPINTALQRYFYKPDYKDKKGILVFTLSIYLIIKCTLLAVVYNYSTNFLMEIFFENQDLLIVFRLYIIILILNPVSSFLLTFIRLLQKAKQYMFFSLISFFISVGLVIFLLVYHNLGILALIVGEIIKQAILSILCLFVFCRRVTFVINPSILIEPLKYGYPLIIQGYSNVLIQSGDRFILNLLSTLSSVGVYSFGNKIASVINLLLVEPMKQVVVPIIFQKEANQEEQKQFILKMAIIYYSIGTFVALGISIYAKEIVMLLTPNSAFWTCWVVIPVILFSNLQHGLGIFLAQGLIMKNKSTQLSTIVLITALTNICFNFILIPYYNILGAAFATLISYVVWNSLKIYYSRKYYNLNFELKRLIHITIIGVSLYLISLALPDKYILLFKFVLFLMYPLILLLTNFFNNDEITIIKKVIYKIIWKGKIQ